MDKKSTTFGLSPEKLAHLMGIGAELSHKDKIDEDEAKAQLLDAFLASAPLVPDAIDSLPIILGRLYQELLPCGGKSVGDLLQNSQTDISVIKQIKDFSKKLAASAGSEPQRTAATAIYYAAIASALIFHNQKITEYSYNDLAQSMSLLIDKKWMSPELARLFKKAREFCHSKGK